MILSALHCFNGAGPSPLGLRSLAILALTVCTTSPIHADKLFAVSAGSNEVYRYEVAATGAPVFEGAITDSSFDRPFGIAFSSSGEMFVTNRTLGTAGSVTRILNTQGTPVPNGTINSTNFSFPSNLTFRNDELFVAQRFGDNVLRFVFNGGSAVENGVIPVGLGSQATRGVTVSPWGELFVSQCCDVTEINRFVFDIAGNAVPNGTITGGGMASPHGIVFTPWGELFVANVTGASISRFVFDAAHNASPNGLIGGISLAGPTGLAFSPWGELFVSNHFAPGGVSRFVFDASHNAIENGSFPSPPCEDFFCLGDLAFFSGGGPANSSTFWIGLKNSDDQGTQFDVRAELYKNGAILLASGQTLCVMGVTRNPTQAKEIFLPLGPLANPVTTGDVLSLKVLTRIGTNPDGSKCSGPGGSHSNAVGLRLYYDAGSRPSRFDAAIPPDSVKQFFLHKGGTQFFDTTPPSATQAQFKDSAALNFAGGNPWKEIGTWSRTQP